MMREWIRGISYHFIWHLFVLMGSSFHFVAVWSQVVPA
ncbi:hypothetical protein Mhypo_02791 [Meiothermus hypogaeus]|uniref:Uncharacterized protein n=1 Tax=Meiothermus hypogaeus TaxID=884155 RepID=A0ABX9MJT9_9DEIN|nr:hypothetical protein Mhypo_02791 [Meiothermus hypogaeus]